MSSPNLCPQCLAKGVIATLNGPTCTHQPAHDAAWFPAWWHLDAFDYSGRRSDWLRHLNAEGEFK